MSDYRDPNFDYRNSNDPLGRNPPFDPDARAMNATWGWIAAAIFLVVVLAVAFGIGHQPGQGGMNTASNDTAPPAASHMMPPTNPTPPTFAPAPASPAPNTPAQRSQP
jgi:hypothetical protein